MNKVYVLIHKDKRGLEVEAFKDKETPVSKVMEEMYGEDWEVQLADEEWELYDELQTNMDILWMGWTWVKDESNDESWMLKEAEVQD